MRGSRKSRVPAIARNSSSIGSMRAEWNAWLTRSRLVLRPRAASASATERTASSAPDTTTDSGPFTAAIPALPSAGSSGRTSSSAARTATIAPPSGRACISRPRAATSRAPSASENTPATCAAASSPMECPATKSGRTPHDSTRRNSAT
ncbi:hypothetical protein RKD19_005617 [Streptomyces canus]